MPENLTRTRLYVAEIGKFSFEVFVITYLVFYIINDLSKGFITDYFNFNTILVVAVAGGLLSFLKPQNSNLKKKRPSSQKEYFAILLAMIGALIIFYKALALNWFWAVVVGIIAFISIILAHQLLLVEET